ncbi:hypothetical protein [Segatella copri]|jgi:hypothetical protein|nr:hypothetical protein [Segatella copri]MCW4075045.1 hypothetical protein [Segatella copri]
MRLRIYYKDFRALMTEIRDRVESGEWSTWRIDNHINAKGQRIRRLVHTPPNDNQYVDIQIRLCLPLETDQQKNVFYVDLVPKLKEEKEMENSELYKKSAVVLGRWCEVLNKDFPNVNEYHVYLKE